MKPLHGQSHPPTSTSVCELHATPPAAVAGFSPPADNGTWRRQGRSLTHWRSTTEPSWSTSVGKPSEPSPSISHAHIRFHRRNGSSVKTRLFRPLATSRPPRSGLHLWLVDIQLLPRQIPYLHASFQLVRFCACVLIGGNIISSLSGLVTYQWNVIV